MEGEHFPMTKTKYKALAAFQGHQPGDEFEADLDEGARAQSDGTRPDQKGNHRRRRRRRPMAKRIALKDQHQVDAVDLSNFARCVEFSVEHERVDVSGFNATGANEYLAGQTEQEVTVEFFGSYGATEVHATLYPIHANREVVAFEWRPDQTAAVSATNPQLEGNVQLLTYNPSATRGEEEAWEATFVAADAPGSPTSPAAPRTWPARRSPSTASKSS